jgi:hypothetical protein
MQHSGDFATFTFFATIKRLHKNGRSISVQEKERLLICMIVSGIA